jgi:beta-lactamase regulating signal transducer with metallopeptidase domain
MLRQYRTSLIAATLVVAIGIWPALIAPLGRLYVAFCARFLTDAPFGHHYPPLVVAFLAPIVTLLVAGLLVALTRQIWGQHRLDASLASWHIEVDERLPQLVHGLGLAGRVVVSRDQAVSVFCGGLLRPRIYLSRGLVELLTMEELEAVLRHERHHLTRHDPLRYFVADLFERLAAFFPALMTVSDRVRIRAELAADQAALRAASIDTLASALIKVMRASLPATRNVAVASLSPTDARVAALLSQPIEVPFNRRDVAISIGLALTALGVALWLSTQSLPLPPACTTCPPF